MGSLLGAKVFENDFGASSRKTSNRLEMPGMWPGGTRIAIVFFGRSKISHGMNSPVFSMKARSGFIGGRKRSSWTDYGASSMRDRHHIADHIGKARCGLSIDALESY
ncbi:hypothetical protein ACLOJK_022604 [Asimina triloba]